MGTTNEFTRVGRDKLVDSLGRHLTQSLFLELGYRPEAVYTLKDEDFIYEGRHLPSIKRLYLEIADPTEYAFANACFTGWTQWQRIVANKQMTKTVEAWRFELEVKIRSEGVKMAKSQSRKGSWQATKWLSDRGWDARGAGRPSKDEVEHERKVQAAVSNEFEEDAQRLRAI